MTKIRVQIWIFWAIGAVSLLTTDLRHWETNWAIFLVPGYLVPGTAASEDKKSVIFEPRLAYRFSTNYWCFIDLDL